MNPTASSPSALAHAFHIITKTALLPAIVFILTNQFAEAGSATWNLNPTSGDWNTAANWTPSTVPNGSSDTATFGSSSITALSNSATTEVNGIVFNAGASAFQVTTNSQLALFRLTGVGITNNSGAIQSFIVDATTLDFGTTSFLNSATAGTSTSFTIAGGRIASGAPATIIFGNTATAGSATFTVNGGVIASANGGLLDFTSTSTAANATVTANGSAVSGATGGVVAFHDTSIAGAAVLVANAGSHGGSGGLISFNTNSTGGTSRVEVFGNGTLDISQRDAPGVTIGSLEGNGLVTLGANNLTLGGSNLTTTFSGSISDNGTSGSVTKVGKGKLTLSKASTYAGGTGIKKGTLLVTNTTGSATGTGAVTLNGGTLGGTGTISGAVSVAGSLTGILAPGGGSRPGTLTILSSIIFNSRATYRVDLNSNLVTADQVVANGVTIDSAAQVSISDLATSTLTPGTVFNIINNTAATAIAGTFNGLPDGSTRTVGSNTYLANYEGGDGNDLTLTVVP
jgi:hypothetical protein